MGSPPAAALGASGAFVSARATEGQDNFRN